MNTAKQILEGALPWMKNAFGFSGIAVGFAVFALLIEAVTPIEYGEAEWIFITLIVRELLGAVGRTVKHYTRGVDDE